MILKTEQKLEDMVDIMVSLQEYVPVSTTNHSYELPGRDDPVCVKLDNFHYILFASTEKSDQPAECNERTNIKRVCM